MGSRAVQFLNSLTGHKTFDMLKNDLTHRSNQVRFILNKALPEVQDEEGQRRQERSKSFDSRGL